MSVQRILITPWQATRASLRWGSLLVFVLCILGAGVVALLPVEPLHWVIVAAVYCLGLGYFWTFMMSSLLILVIDARQLRLPSISRTVAWSLLWHGVAMVIMPVLLLQALGHVGLVSGLMMALAITAGMALALLPRYLSSLVGFAPAILIGLHHGTPVRLALSGEPRFMIWAGAAVLALLLLNVLRWRALASAENPREHGYASAMVMQFRRNGAMGHWSGLAQRNSTPLLRRRPRWMLVRADLRKVGPQSPVASLLVALGGWYMPQRWESYLRQSLLMLLPVAALVAALTLMQLGEPHRQDWQSVWQGTGLGVVGWIGTFGGLMLAATAALAPAQRWKQANGELALLALLPGLGNAASARANLLRAALLKPLLGQAVLLALVIGSALALQLSGIALGLLILVQLGCAGAMVGLVLNTFGGVAVSLSARIALLLCGSALLSVSSFIPLIARPWPLNGVLDALLALAWAAFGGALLWFARRGWRGLQQRPHPFLVSET